MEAKPYQIIPDPSKIPFGVIPDMPPDPYNTHTLELQVEVMTTNSETNPFPWGHFTGPIHHQVNQPQYLSVNDTYYTG